MHPIEEALTSPSQIKKLNIAPTELEAYWLKQLPKLKNLTTLNIQGHQELTKIPVEIAQLPKLKKLTITDFGLTTIPDFIFDCPKLEKLTIYRCPITALSRNIHKLSSLKELRIAVSQIASIPTSISQCSQLSFLMINRSQLKSIPKEISELNELQQLLFEENQLKELPESLAQLPKLHRIVLNQNKFEEIPSVLYAIPNLKTIQITDNKIKAVSPMISQLKHLETLYISNNNFSQFPFEVLNWYSKLNNPKFNLSVSNHLIGDGIQYSDIHQFTQTKTYNDLSIKEQEHYFRIFNNDKNYLQKQSIHQLLPALNFTKKEIALHTLLFLTQQENAKPLKKGDEVVLLGKTTINRKVLQKRIKAVGLEYSTKIQASTTHVLISAKGNKKIDQVPDSLHWSWITETELMQFLDQEAPSYLVEDSADTERTHISSLILSLEEENITLALELLSGGGVSSPLFTELFIVYKLSDNASSRKKAKALLKQKADAPLLEILNSKKAINSAQIHRKQPHEFKKRLDTFSQHEHIQRDKLVYAVYMKTGAVLEEVLTHCQPSLQNKALIQHVKTNYNRFKISKYSYKPVDYTFTTFPDAILQVPQLESISIHVQNEFLVDGEWIKNTHFELPETLGTMTALRELIIEDYVFEKLPMDVLTELQHPHLLNLLTNDSEDQLAVLEKALPNTKLNIWFRKKE